MFGFNGLMNVLRHPRDNMKRLHRSCGIMAAVFLPAWPKFLLVGSSQFIKEPASGSSRVPRAAGDGLRTVVDEI